MRGEEGYSSTPISASSATRTSRPCSPRTQQPGSAGHCSGELLPELISLAPEGQARSRAPRQSKTSSGSAQEEVHLVVGDAGAGRIHGRHPAFVGGAIRKDQLGHDVEVVGTAGQLRPA